MSALLGGIGALICFVAVGYFWFAAPLLPRLGAGTLRHSTAKRLVMCGAGLAATLFAALDSRSIGSWIAVGLAGLLTAAVGVVRPDNIFAALERTDHVDAERAELSGDAEVIGLEVDGDAVAWPILEMLAPRHVVNDEVGGKRVVASYCPACRSGMVFSRVVGGRALTFTVAGLWRKNMVAIDGQTSTLWQQATGEGIVGPLCDQELEILFAEQTAWATWRAGHPGSKLAVAPKDARRGIVPERLFRRIAMEGTKKIAVPGLHRADPRLLPHDEVAGLKIGDGFRAYPMKAVQAAGEIRDRHGAVEIVLTWDAGGTVRATVDGAPIHVQRHWWLSWSEFYPDTTLWEPPRRQGSAP
jgi:hypothetical protein